MELDEGEFEYSWYETVGPVHFVKSGLVEKVEEMNRRQFRLIDHQFISQQCELIDNSNPSYGEQCKYKDTYLFERQSRLKKSVQQHIAYGSPGWGARPSVELTTELEEHMRKGFYPVRAFSRFEILLEALDSSPDADDPIPDVKVVRSEWGRESVLGKANELARQGYRLGMVNRGIAILYRNDETKDLRASYVGLDPRKRDFVKKLESLKARSSRYITSFPNDKGQTDILVFETSLAQKRPNAEVKVLGLGFHYAYNESENLTNRTLDSASRNLEARLNELVRQGFRVKGLSDVGDASIILEREL